MKRAARYSDKDVYPVGSQPPTQYIAWHAWAGVQYRGGLRQRRCPECGLWKFPQEMCCHGVKPKPKRRGKR